MKLPSRNHWITSSQFHPHDVKEIFEEIKKRISQKSDPIVLLDLDSTLYEVAHRTNAIIQDWVKTAPKTSQTVLTALANAKTNHIGYSLKDSFEKLGLSLDTESTLHAHNLLKDFWWERFFSNQYLPHDKPYPEAVETAKTLYGLGAKIFYLTGREKGAMEQGTIKNLIRDNFPWDDKKTHLLMRHSQNQSDLDYKKEAAEFIKTQGTLIASIENEPQNLVALFEFFPEAMHIFMDTVCSENGAKPVNGIYKISGFKSSAT